MQGSNNGSSNDSKASHSNCNQTFSNNDSTINKTISGNLASDTQQLRNIFDRSFDIIFRDFEIGGLKKGLLIFVDEFVNSELLNADVLKPLMDYGKSVTRSESIKISEMRKFIQNQVITASNIKIITNIQEVVDWVLSGESVLLLDGEKQAISMDLRNFKKRSVEESTVEPLLRGPRDGFTEDLHTNISLLRKRLKTPKLKMEIMRVGALSRTDIVITYLDGIVKDPLVEEVRQRITKIDIDAILESGYIEELIQDNAFSVFPQLGATERPDRLAAALLEGSVGILVDNTPMALITPEVFVDLIDATEDYYGNYIFASANRLLRYLFLGVSVFLPAFYIALLTFHQGMVSRTLLLSIISSREGVPFPLFVESLMMQIFFEGLQEASTRLPRVVGQTVSIVGGLVLGQAAVQAGIVSAATVIVVSITGIATFIIPRFNLTPTIRIIRLFMIILGGMLGLYGIFIGTLITLIHMVKLRSFGAPYLSPIAPLKVTELKDTFVRAPLWSMILRPGYTEPKDKKRMKKNLRPRTPRRNK